MDWKKAKLRYHQQKAQSKSRLDKNGNQILWNLTFEQWIDIWINSGHWDQRGCKLGDYCMTRKNDVGHYEVGNVEIKSISENVKEGQTGRKFPQKGRTGPRGPYSQERKNAISLGRQKYFNRLKEERLCV